MITRGKGKRIARYCAKCSKRFVPTGRAQKLCKACFKKAMRREE